MSEKITGYFTPKSSKRGRCNSSPDLGSHSGKKSKVLTMPEVSMTVEQLKSIFSDLLDSKNIATKQDIDKLTLKIDSLQMENHEIKKELEIQKRINKKLENE